MWFAWILEYDKKIMEFINWHWFIYFSFHFRQFWFKINRRKSFIFYVKHIAWQAIQTYFYKIESSLMSWSLGTTCGQKSSIVNRASYTTILDKVTVNISCGDLFLHAWASTDMYFEKKSLGNKTIYLQLHFCL